MKLLIVDDHPIFRRGLREVIGEDARSQIVGEASDGEEAMRMIGELKPQIAIVDIDMPRLNGLEMARALQNSQHPVTTIFFTGLEESKI